MSTQWFYRLGEEQHGPLVGKSLKLLAEVGQITSTTLVRKQGTNSWIEAHHVKQLFDSHTPAPAAPPVIEKSVKVKPAARVRAVEESPAPPVIATAANHAATPVAVNPTPLEETQISICGPAPDKQQRILDRRQTKNRSFPLIVTLLGLIVVAIPALWYLYWNPATNESAPGSGAVGQLSTDQVLNPDQTPLTTSQITPNPIKDVFAQIHPWQDATEAKINLSGNAAVTVTHAWLTPGAEVSNTEEDLQTGILSIVVTVENLDSNRELTLPRQYVNQDLESSANTLNPYLPLAQLGNGDTVPLRLKQPLQNRSIPGAGKITETYDFVVPTNQLGHLRIAIPKAWFKKTGYIGFIIPRVMITSTDSVPESEGDSPIRVASEVPTSGDTPITVNRPAAVNPAPSSTKGQLPPSPFGAQTPSKTDAAPKPKNGDQPGTIQDLQSQIRTEKNRDNNPAADPKPR